MENYRDGSPENKMWIELGIFAAIVLIIFIRVKKRRYFWKDKQGNKLTFKEFKKRFWKGVEGITPKQQTKTQIISQIPIFGGLIWGSVVSFISEMYWLGVILIFALPINFMSFISNLQKYKTQKKAEELMAEAEKNSKEMKGGNEKTKNE